MATNDYPESRTDGILTQTLGEEILVYDLDRDKVLCLNETTAMVWRECDGTRSVPQISRALAAKVGTTVSEDVVWMAVRQLKTENLLAVNESFETPFDSMTRREMVLRVGFVTVAALPAIFQVAAPTAAHAQSLVCGPLGTCTGSGTATCICIPPAPVGGNINPDGCECRTNGDCAGNCRCGNPCTAGTCSPGESCQSGICQDPMGGGSLTPCNGSCPAGQSCVTDMGDSAFGTCAGTCPPSSFNTCIGAGTSNPICIPGNQTNLSADCCPCDIDGDCAGCCSNNNAPGVPGICIPCV